MSSGNYSLKGNFYICIHIYRYFMYKINGMSSQWDVTFTFDQRISRFDPKIW